MTDSSHVSIDTVKIPSDLNAWPVSDLRAVDWTGLGQQGGLKAGTVL